MHYFYKYSFTILLVLTCLIVLPVRLYHTAGVQIGECTDQPVVQTDGRDEETGDAGPEHDVGNDGAVPAAESPVPQSGSGSHADPRTPEETQTGGQDDGAGSHEVNCAFTDVQQDYFDDALFIGDSRTVGISEYGNLDHAAFFANTGMSVYNLFSESVSVAGVGDTDLNGLLEHYSYGKIYVMLGINELGYNHSKTVDRYSEVLSKIRRYEPDALIFLEANLYVTAAKSDKDPIFNNDNIRSFNHDISQMADGKTIFYLDVNPVFDDGHGNLAPEYTGDGAHVYGKYYETWSEWFRTKGIVKP